MSTQASPRWSRAATLFRRYANPVALARHVQARRECSRRDAAASGLGESLFGEHERLPEVPRELPRLHVPDVNLPDAVSFVRRLKPECIVVSGTNLLRSSYFDGSIGAAVPIINIHTGLSPYSRGGNCNLFCILHAQPQLVGVTVHHIDAGIDSGDIIFTARPSFEVHDTFEKLELKVCRLGEDLLMLALEKLVEGVSPRHRQWATGRLFLRRTGYLYEPYLRCRANELLGREGLIRQYLFNRDKYDESLVLFEPSEPPTLWRHAKT